MTMREKLGLSIGDDINQHPVYTVIAQGRHNNHTVLTANEFIDKYLDTWKSGLSFNWKFMKWTRRKHGDMSIFKIGARDNRSTRYAFHMSISNKQISRVDKDELIEIRNNYIIDNNLLGEFTLL